MIAYLIKSAISLLILYLVYHFLLSKEKAYQFNRYFLLGSLIFSLCVPFIQSPLKPHTKLVRATPTFSSLTSRELIPENQMVANSTPIEVVKETDNMVSSKQTQPLWTIFLAIYLLVLLALLIRMAINLRTLFLKIKKGPIIDQGPYKTVLSRGKDLPFTFLKYIFLEKSQFLNGQVNSQLLLHEEIHALQWHSLDILFIEVLKSIFWFNPVLHLYKKAIQLNHEFIADEAVVHSCEDKKGYQYLLLSHVLQHQQNHLVSYSKYSLTKNRITMMNKTKNWPKTAVKVLLATPFALGIIFIVGMKQNQEIPKKDTIQITTKISQNNPPQNEDLVKEYETLIQNSIDENGNKSFSKLDIPRLREIWDQMTENQRQTITHVPFVPAPTIPSKMKISQSLINEWKDSNTYGVWLDGKRINNEELNVLYPDEIAFFVKSKLEKNAINFGKHVYQLNLMTHNAYYKSYILSKSLYDQKSVYSKAIEIYNQHQSNPQLYKGKLGSDIDVLQKIYERIPQWEKEKYNVKTPSEAIKGESKQNGIGFNYIPYFKPQKNDKC